MRFIFIWLLLVAPAVAETKPRVVRVATPKEAVAYATQDILQVPKADQPFMRYIWATDPSSMHTGAMVYTLNAVLSQSADSYMPKVMYDGAMIRLDLRRLAPFPEDFVILRDTYEELAVFEPYFHTNRIFQQTIETRKVLRKVAPYIQDGKRFDTKWVIDNTADPSKEKVEITTKTDKALVSEFSIHTGMENALLLGTLTGSRVPVVRSDWFVLKAWTTLNDGFYYKFLQIQKPDNTFISLDDWLNRSGADENDFKKWKANQKPSDERAATFRSKITDKPRGVALFQSKDVRPSLGSPVITITEDIIEENTDPLAHHMQTLLNPKFNGHEAIKRRRNGTIEFLVADANGVVLPSVPENIAVDRTIPGPGPVRLEAGMSCLACHGPFDGYMPFQNDVQKLLSTYLAVYDDENTKDPVPETLEVLAGKYKGDLSTTLLTLRRDTQRTANLITEGQSFINTSAAIVATRDKYYYDAITPRIACRDLGYTTRTETDAQQLFPVLIPMLPVNKSQVRPEDPFIAALRGYDLERWPVRLRRSDWERIYADVALRAATEETNRSNTRSKVK